MLLSSIVTVHAFSKELCYRWDSFQDQILCGQVFNPFLDKIDSELQKALHFINPEYVGMLKQVLTKWIYVYSSAEMVLLCFPNIRNYLFDNWPIAYLLYFHVKLFYFPLYLFSLFFLLTAHPLNNIYWLHFLEVGGNVELELI